MLWPIVSEHFEQFESSHCSFVAYQPSSVTSSTAIIGSSKYTNKPGFLPKQCPFCLALFVASILLKKFVSLFVRMSFRFLFVLMVNFWFYDFVLLGICRLPLVLFDWHSSWYFWTIKHMDMHEYIIMLQGFLIIIDFRKYYASLYVYGQYFLIKIYYKTYFIIFGEVCTII